MEKLVVLSVPFIAALLVACAEACGSSLPPEPAIVVFPPYDGGDAEVPHDKICELACENLAKMGCPESVPAGRSCASLCSQAEHDGFDLRPLCVANARTPDEVRGCCDGGAACSRTRCAGR
jgi:hypothetical protein